MNIRVLAWTVCMAAVSVPLAMANDTSARLVSGGLVFGKQLGVVMQSEDLYISPDMIRVRYVFRNETATDLETIVAFPLPETAPSGDIGGGYNFGDGVTANFVDFKTWADGTPVVTQVEQKALALGLDRTEILNRLGVPIGSYIPPTDPRSAFHGLSRLSEAEWGELAALGLLRIDPQGHPSPGWTVATTFYWTQVFPAGKDTVIEHQYRPLTGSSFDAPISSDPDNHDAARAAIRFCISEQDRKALHALHDGKIDGRTYTAFSEELGYILKTAANWSGAIRDFHLVIEAREPIDFVFACLPGLKRISPSRLELSEAQFWPFSDLDVLFVISKPLDN